MLRRQQAEAIISARTKIVTGAVSMVEMALNELSAKAVVQLDDERKASMVNNLMTVLCAESDVQPVDQHRNALHLTEEKHERTRTQCRRVVDRGGRRRRHGVRVSLWATRRWGSRSVSPPGSSRASSPAAARTNLRCGGTDDPDRVALLCVLHSCSGRVHHCHNVGPAAGCGLALRREPRGQWLHVARRLSRVHARARTWAPRVHRGDDRLPAACAARGDQHSASRVLARSRPPPADDRCAECERRLVRCPPDAVHRRRALRRDGSEPRQRRRSCRAGCSSALLTTFVVVLAFWIVSFYLRFRNPR